VSDITTRAAGATDVGRVRDQNEDAYFVGAHVFAVADGLGGHLGGEVASNLALEPVSALDAQAPAKAADQLANAIRRANKTVHDRAQRDHALKGMGTTMTALAIDGAHASLGHVGDSRCYLVRAGRISQISTDHTLVARMVDEGKLTQEQAETHPQRSILTRALVWALVVLLVLGGGALAVRVWVNSSWYVGLHDEQVAIYHGVPVNVAGLRLSSVAENTGLRADRLPPQLRANVEQGISAPTLYAARTIVRERIEPNARPEPAPSPTPNASATPTAKATK
jgi:hypothetical protein